jgi:hypothetical protein
MKPVSYKIASGHPPAPPFLPDSVISASCEFTMLMCNTWLGVVPGVAVYIGSGICSPEEEKLPSTRFVVEGGTLQHRFSRQ